MHIFKRSLSLLVAILLLSVCFSSCATPPDLSSLLLPTFDAGNVTILQTSASQLESGFRVTATFTLSDQKASAGILLSEPANEEGKFNGFSALLSTSTLSLYTISNGDWKVTATRDIPGIALSTPLSIRLERTGRNLRLYFLDDMEGISPWPEIEIAVPPAETIMHTSFVDCSKKASSCQALDVETFAAEESENTFRNPVDLFFADPEVLYHDGTYYLYGTGGAGYTVKTSTDLVNWSAGTLCMEQGAWGFQHNYWAPDIEYIDGKFYMVCSINEHLGFAVADSPLGPFIPMENYLFEKTIDGHIFVDDNGEIYLYYVSWREGHSYGIYGCKIDRETMAPDLSTEKLIIEPEETWEKYDKNENQYYGVTEGPYMIKHKGKYYLTYSGSDYRSKNYAVGYAVSDSPLGDFQKHDGNPIMIGNSTIAGTAHHSFVTMPSGNLYIVYHCHDNPWAMTTRFTCIGPARFAPTESGIDRLEAWPPSFVFQEIPK
ncbi:MAG: glycoside hydrolase family 43 protein [Oscillospiraceae bacterium]|nr:glycoside hydrolase family 43 protein [Oscillospiraceae bacterium]